MLVREAYPNPFPTSPLLHLSPQGLASAPDPKTPVLIEVLTQHFGGVVEDPLLAATTRAIVFCSYREVVNQLEGALAAYAPLIHAR